VSPSAALEPLTSSQINAQIIKPEERIVLSRLVQLMITHKLRFFQEKSEDGKLSYRLDPFVFPTGAFPSSSD
jgi:hypothetical protein